MVGIRVTHLYSRQHCLAHHVLEAYEEVVSFLHNVPYVSNLLKIASFVPYDCIAQPNNSSL